MDDDHDRARAKLVERRGFALDPARRDFQPPQQDQAAEEAYREHPVRPRPLVRRVAHEDHRRLHHGRRAALDPAERRRSQDHVRGTIPHDRSGLRQRQARRADAEPPEEPRKFGDPRIRAGAAQPQRRPAAARDTHAHADHQQTHINARGVERSARNRIAYELHRLYRAVSLPHQVVADTLSAAGRTARLPEDGYQAAQL